MKILQSQTLFVNSTLFSNEGARTPPYFYERGSSLKKIGSLWYRVKNGQHRCEGSCTLATLLLEGIFDGDHLHYNSWHPRRSFKTF